MKPDVAPEWQESVLYFTFLVWVRCFGISDSSTTKHLQTNKKGDCSKDSNGLNLNEQNGGHTDFQSFTTMTVCQVGSMQGIYKNTTS